MTATSDNRYFLSNTSKFVLINHRFSLTFNHDILAGVYNGVQGSQLESGDSSGQDLDPNLSRVRGGAFGYCQGEQVARKWAYYEINE